MVRTMAILGLLCCSLPNPIQAADEPKPTAPVKPQKPQPTPEELFTRLDKDKNGVLTVEEFRGIYKTKQDDAKVSLAFRKRDKDANGKLTLAEFAAGQPKEEPPAAEPEPAKVEPAKVEPKK